MVSGTETPTGRERIRLVSIVLPTYEGDRYLAEAIRSCLTQTYPHLELLIVDDGSRRDIRGIVEANQDARVRYLRHSENRGLSAALNTGFAAARGDYLAWTSDDNRYHPEAIVRMVDYLESHREVGLVYAGCRVIDGQGRPIGVLPAEPPERIWTMNCVRACFLYRREVRDRVGPYDPEVPLVEDYDYWLRTARWFRLGRLKAILYDLRVHPRQLTHTLSLDRKRDSHLRVLAKLRDCSGGAPVPAAVQRQARAAVHAAYGRDYFFSGQTRPARRELWASICVRPSNICSRLTVLPLLKSMVGDKWLSRIRTFRKPTVEPAVPRLRLLHCSGRFAVGQGGAERQARDLASHLAARGHQVSVLTLKDLGVHPPLPGVVVYPRIRAFELGRLFGISYLCSAASHLLWLGKRADLIFAHHLYLDAVAALAAARVWKLPVVAKVEGGGVSGDMDRLRRTAGGSILLRWLRTLDAVVVPSHACLEEVLAARFPKDRVHRIPNGVDTRNFRPDLARERGASLEISGSPIVVFVGRLVESKGVLELLDSWSLLVRRHARACLVIIGSGPLGSVLRDRVDRSRLGSRVHFAGEVRDVRPYLGIANAFVLPSWAEGLPVALLEAMAMELPCVATDLDGSRDAITHGVEGLLVPPRDPRALADALTVVLGQPDLARRLGRAARKRVETEFSLEREVDALEALYREIISRRGREARRT